MPLRTPPTTVTLFSDASWCPDTLVAGWGGWVKSNRVSIGQQFSGGFKGLLNSSNEAELKAAVNVLQYAMWEGVVESRDTILFQLDNTAALNMINNKQGAATRGEEDAMKKLEEFRLRQHLIFKIKHIKAHKRESTRSGVNECCDRLARIHMDALRVHVGEGRDVSEYKPGPTATIFC